MLVRHTRHPREALPGNAPGCRSVSAIQGMNDVGFFRIVGNCPS